MEENIKVQAEDTQKVEYLDKNGLDLLWTKVKKNAQDQVEVEYNRAKGKEDEITNSVYTKAQIESKLGQIPHLSNFVTKKAVFKASNNKWNLVTSIDRLSLKKGQKFYIYFESTDNNLPTLQAHLNQGGTNKHNISINVENEITPEVDVYSIYFYANYAKDVESITFTVYTKDATVVETTGQSDSSVMSQKAVTTELNSIKSSIPSKISQLTNDSNFITTTQIPVATKEQLGVVKVGDGIDINNGIISVASSNCYSTVNQAINRAFTNFEFDGSNKGSSSMVVKTDNDGLCITASTIRDKENIISDSIKIGVDNSDEYLGGYISISDGTEQNIKLTPTGIFSYFYNSNDIVYTTDGGVRNLDDFVKVYNRSSKANTYYTLSCGTSDSVDGNRDAFFLEIKSSGINIGYGDSQSSITTKINAHEIYSTADFVVRNITIDKQQYDGCIKLSDTGSDEYGSDHVFATDGGILDMTQYVKKGEITAGGNVDDVQINGASVVSDKVANIKLATKDDFGVVKVGNGLDINDGVVGIAQDYVLDQLSYGVEWDTTVANPACTRIGNPLLHKSLPIQSKYKGCLVKNGKVNYYLDPNDWSKKADGSASVLDGTDGDVMVHIPKFYGKSGSNGNKRWVRISLSQIDSTWVEIPEMFVSAYRITAYSDSGTTKVASVVNTSAEYRGGTNNADYDKYLDTDKFRTLLGKPITYKSRAVMRTNAKNSDQELLCYEFYKWIFYWAYVIEYANFNSQLAFNYNLTSDGYHQGGLGSGLTSWDYGMWTKYNGNNPLTPCGYTNELGNFSGVKSLVIPETKIDDTTTISTKTLSVNRWRGFENPFGDIWTNLDGIVLKRSVANGDSNVYTTTDSSKFGDDVSVMDISGTEIAKDGYIKEFDLGETGEVIPSDVGASESTYKCDYHWCNSSSIENRTLLVGGYAANGGVAGLGSFGSFVGVGAADSNVGFRSVIRV